jgi:UPF0716 family protein affecting phage T7 exclusion
MFGYIPFITAANPPTQSGQSGGQPIPGVNLSSLSLIITGGVLTTIGFFTIIAGIVIVVLDSRKRTTQKSDSGRVTEGGITYKKD